jgi:hypothetical protein
MVPKRSAGPQFQQCVKGGQFLGYLRLNEPGTALNSKNSRETFRGILTNAHAGGVFLASTTPTHFLHLPEKALRRHKMSRGNNKTWLVGRRAWGVWPNV